MTRIFIILILFISFYNCRSSKSSNSKNEDSKVIISSTRKTNKKTKAKINDIIDYAMKFKGVKYKSGGTTKAGMDCSGLVFEVFRKNDIILPRSSREMAEEGHKINIRKVSEGDLLFFETGGKRNGINHVGLVVDTRKDKIKFIHSTNREGVVISDLSEAYWEKSFKEARRIL